MTMGIICFVCFCFVGVEFVFLVFLLLVCFVFHILLFFTHGNTQF